MYNNNNYGYNPYNRYYPPVMQPQLSDNGSQSGPQYGVPQFTKSSVLQGKQVDSLDVVKAMDIPMDGSVSYFPIADGSAIVTKQLQMDGTSKMVIFKPIDDEPNVKYITPNELEKYIKNIDLTDIDDLKEDVKDLKSNIKDIQKKLKSKEE